MLQDPAPRTFATTHWTMVLSAKDANSPDSQRAMAALCETYWYPLYAYVRRVGHSAADAEDLTQAFFARFLENRFLDAVVRERGRFRSFMLACMRHFVSNERDRTQSLKRGGGHRRVTLDFEYGEDRYRHEPAHDVTPEKLYERSWGEILLKEVIEQLKKEYNAAGKGELFSMIEPYLGGQRPQEPYAQLAERSGMTEGAIKMSIKRLRQRCGQLLRDEIAHTVDCPEDIDQEIRDLFDAVG